MRNFHKLDLIALSVCNAFLLPLVQCSAHEGLQKARSYRSIQDGHEKLSHQKRFDIQLHGLLLWISMGFLMPFGILTIRMSGRMARGSTQLKVFFYLHVVFQTLSLLLATAGAVMSLRKFENLFNNSHQRIGLALYIAIWAQAVIGIFRPQRGKKERNAWFLTHWILGTIISIVGIINIYTGLNAYHKKTSRSIGLWTVLFTAEISFIGFFYLFQDKWEFLQKQGVVLGESEALSPSDEQVETQRQNSKELLPDPCTKQNALRNLFD
ncbi:cytochrome b561 domain-containing protein At4g18260 [Benincasa hispida]|uniref:cytochrome b561 domain-containing protein At4g18260 n=1 Tax=Benincasa hispida TaxID=102211 RepID=UPI0018FF3701|nr:cytochrome b561 domain-containing protein At4g18260 [Benincasa hispida]